MPGQRPFIAALTVVPIAVAIGLPMWAGCGSEKAAATSAAPDNATAAATADSPAAEVQTPSPPAPKPKLRPGAKTVALSKAGDRSYDKTFDDIRFDLKPGDRFERQMLTEAIEALTGQRIRIRGYILPTAQQRGITQFVLVRDNQECCFGPGAALYDCIFVEMKSGKTAQFSIRPVAVEGTFSVNEVIGPDGKQLAIYHLDGESVQQGSK